MKRTVEHAEADKDPRLQQLRHIDLMGDIQVQGEGDRWNLKWIFEIV
jgi:hypothetical protein